MSARECSLTTPACSSFYRARHTFEYNFKPDNFLAWGDNDVGEIKAVRHRAKGNATITAVRKIPIGYIQLVDQLVKESIHGMEGTQESVRRSAYADLTLDAFACELFSKKEAGPKFRSKVLTPLMQRHRMGIADHYTPVLQMAIGGDTAADATIFYLREDPIESRYLSQYRRSLMYIPESRWHLGILLGTIELRNQADFGMIWRNHDRIQVALRDGDYDDDDDDDDSEEYEDSDDEAEIKLPRLNAVEVAVILEERLEDFFEAELALVVSNRHNIHICH